MPCWCLVNEWPFFFFTFTSCWWLKKNHAAWIEEVCTFSSPPIRVKVASWHLIKSPQCGYRPDSYLQLLNTLQAHMVLGIRNITCHTLCKESLQAKGIFRIASSVAQEMSNYISNLLKLPCSLLTKGGFIRCICISYHFCSVKAAYCNISKTATIILTQI